MRALYAAKVGILARNSQSSVVFDWKSHTRKNIFRDSDWTYNFFHACKTLARTHLRKKILSNKKGLFLTYRIKYVV